MKPSIKVRVLGLLLDPLLKKLGYTTNRTDLGLPESSYYYGRSGLADLVEIHLGFLSDSGWLESRNCNRSFYNGKFQPWLTFAATHFLSSIDMAGMSVVEFGGGLQLYGSQKEQAMSLPSNLTLAGRPFCQNTSKLRQTLK